MFTLEALTELEEYFKTKEIPQGLVQLKPAETTPNLAQTIDTTIKVLKANPDNKSYGGHWERLYKIKELLESQG